jgi:polyisoprenoid-binding protein YceI
VAWIRWLNPDYLKGRDKKLIIMKMNYRKMLFMLVFAVTGLYGNIYSQETYKINNAKDINMKLSGTSTLHKWAMDAKSFTGNARFGFSKGTERELNSVTSLNFSLAVADLKSGEKGLDKNAYKALKTDKYKDILYTLTSAKVSPVKENRYLVKTQGNLSIAGVTNKVAIDVYCVLNEDKSITCSGSDKLKMTDYLVKPPSFMLGAMKTGDAITLDFTLVYNK